MLAAILLFLEENVGLDEDSRIYLQRLSSSFDKLGIKTSLQLGDGLEIFNPQLRFLRFGLNRTIFVSAVLLGYVLLSVVLLFLGILIFQLTSRKLFRRDLITFYEDIHIIHYVGGGYINDRWLGILLFECLTLKVARLINPNIRILGTGLGFGPFRNDLSTRLFRNLLGSFDSVFLRDTTSHQLVTKFEPSLRPGCLGDDACLLFPKLKDLSRRISHRNLFAVNLKDFPDHSYDGMSRTLSTMIEKAQRHDISPTYFSFGEKPGPDDYQVLQALPGIKKRITGVHSAYQDGFDEFMGNLCKTRIAVGFAYHFSVILSILSIPCLAVYQGDYYEQKMKGASDMLASPYVIGLDEFSDQAIQFIDSAVLSETCTLNNEAVVASLYDAMVSAYTHMYKQMIAN